MPKITPLLCEFHAHTTWSDGLLSMRELCDLYGRSGFDVLAITDHTTRTPEFVDRPDFPAYLAALLAESAYARSRYDLLVIPGLELTYDDPDPTRAGHALAIGLRAFVGVDEGLEPAVRAARAHGAALIGAHPYRPEDVERASRRTAAFASDPGGWSSLVDRFELFNRDTLFAWVAEAGLAAVACGDFHHPGHLATWKTLLPCAKDEASVLDYLRSPRPGFLAQLGERPLEVAKAA